MPSKNTVLNQIFDLELKKSDRTKATIAEAAIHNFVKYGLENTNFESIAKQAGLSRTIVVRYFPDKDLLMQFVATYIRATYQQYVIERFVNQSDPQKQLSSYIRASMDWVSDMPKHSAVWLLFFYYCAIRKEYRKLHTDLVEMGLNRIHSILAAGNQQGLFASANLKNRGRSIQIYLSGSIVALLTESEVWNAQLSSDTHKICMRMAKGELAI